MTRFRRAMAPISGSVSSSESLAFGDASGKQQSSGQHGNVFTFQLGGKGNTATPSLTDSSGSLPPWLWAALIGGGILLALILKKKKGQPA